MDTRLHTLRQLLRTVLGLAIFSFGVYLTIQANIGLAPWDALSMGVSLHTPLRYGTAHMLISLLILIIDLLLREKIGWGTVFDALLVGNFVDLFTALNVLPLQSNVILGVAVMAAGLLIMALGQYFYMSAGQGCGPRDAFVVGVGRRMACIPIGVVNTIILCAALCGGWLLGAPIGLGTVISAVGIGAAMQLVFHLLHFEPRNVVHRNLAETTRQLLTVN